MVTYTFKSQDRLAGESEVHRLSRFSDSISRRERWSVLTQTRSIAPTRLRSKRIANLSNLGIGEGVSITGVFLTPVIGLLVASAFRLRHFRHQFTEASFGPKPRFSRVNLPRNTRAEACLKLGVGKSNYSLVGKQVTSIPMRVHVPLCRNTQSRRNRRNSDFRRRDTSNGLKTLCLLCV